MDSAETAETDEFNLNAHMFLVQCRALLTQSLLKNQDVTADFENAVEAFKRNCLISGDNPIEMALVIKIARNIVVGDR